LTLKQKNTSTVFEALGFPEGMTYGHRSSLRKECSRFLRFAYLIDFLSLEALSNIYIGSVHGMIERLRELDDSCEQDKIMDMDIDDMNKNPAGPNRGNEPLFYVKVTIHDLIPISEESVHRVEI
jgi:dynein heavy chain